MIDYRLKDDYEIAKSICEKYVGECGYNPLDVTDVIISNKMTRNLGVCEWDTRTGKSKIKISYSLVDKKYPRKLRQATLIHELLHAYFPKEHHKGRWSKFAKVISQNTDYNIERLADSEELSALQTVRKNDYKYVVVCERCGREVKKTRMCSIVRYPQNWRCGKCGGTFKRVV